MQIFLEALKSGWGALLEYLSAHVLTCLVPAFFIAGTVATENESKDKDDPEEQNSQDGSYQSSDTSEEQDNSLKGIYERFIKFGKPSILIFSYDADKVPLELTNLVRVGAGGGAALSGTVQTENIGFEKIICNIVANPNIRYLILVGLNLKVIL